MGLAPFPLAVIFFLFLVLFQPCEMAIFFLRIILSIPHYFLEFDFQNRLLILYLIYFLNRYLNSHSSHCAMCTTRAMCANFLIHLENCFSGKKKTNVRNFVDLLISQVKPLFICGLTYQHLVNFWSTIHFQDEFGQHL